MFSKTALLALCAITSTALAAATQISVSGPTCAVPCGISDGIKRSVTGQLLMFINLPETITHPLAALTGEVFRGNDTTGANKALACIIGLQGTNDLAGEMDVFRKWFSTLEGDQITNSFKKVLDGTAKNYEEMVSALEVLDSGMVTVKKEAIANLVIAFQARKRSEYSNDPDTDEKVTEALGVYEAGQMYHSLKYYNPGNAGIMRYMVTGKSAYGPTGATGTVGSKPAHEEVNTKKTVHQKAG